ncbi:MAG: hypothetical protein K0R57_5945 [Paenibacillaceae bacterium]|jgi:AraC-like DNA-binding protein|nr:hypothetical protein [Paenibacillaceae bacterium]
MKLPRIRLNTQSVVVNWLVSYISVLLVPILICAGIYVATWNVVVSEVNRANESVLKQMEQSIDSNLAGIERLSLEMALSKRLAGFIDVSQPLTDNDLYDVIGISNDLKVYKMANNYLEQIYIYYKNSDTVISNRDRGDSRKLFGSIGTEDNWDAGEWADFFDKRYVQEYLPITITDDGQATKGVMYAKSVILANQDQPGAVLLFIIKESMLLGQTNAGDRSTVAILDKENRIIASAGQGYNSELLTYSQMSGKNGVYYAGSGKSKVAISYTTSGNTGWKYASIIPANIFDEKMQLVKTLIYLSLGLSVAVGGVVTFLSLKRNYSPINSLVNSLVNQSGISFKSGSDEYVYLQSAFNNTLDEKRKMGQRLEQHRNAIRSHVLQTLLKGGADSQGQLEESLEAHSIRLTSSEFAVLLFGVDHYGKFADSGQVEPQKAQLVHFIIMNVAEEVAGSAHLALTTEMEGMQACIINFRDPEDRDVLAIVQKIRAFMLEHFHVQMTVAVSGVHEEVSGIAKAYQEARAAFEYRLVLGSDRIIRYGDLPRLDAADKPARYHFPLHVEQQLINFVKSGDYGKSSALLNEIVEANISGGAMPVSLAKCLMFDLIGTMVKTLDETGASGKADFMEEVDPVQRLTSCGTMEEMRQQIDEVLRRVCQSIQEDQKQQSRHLSKEIMQYVTEHYCSDDLNVSSIGEAFKLTPSYLSKQFRLQAGEALPDYINKIRMEEAKRLLREESCSIAEAAKRVGYADMNTFNRIFKKHEGITPGKYKEIQ